MPFLHELHHIGALDGIRTMVEVEDSQIAIPTVDAGMLVEVLSEKLLRVSAALSIAGDNHCYVLVTVRRVVPAGGLAVAVTTHFLQPVSARALSIEIGQWLRLPTGSAHLLLRL